MRGAAYGGILVGIGCGGDASADQSQGSPAIRLAVATQASTETALWPSGQEVPSSALGFESGPQLGDGVRTWRVSIPRDHWHPYLVATAGAEMFLLGGFECPDLKRIAVHLRAKDSSAQAIVVTAQKLAVAADPSGAVRAGCARARG